MQTDTLPCTDSVCDCRAALNRRDFVKTALAGTAAAGAGELPVVAGPFDSNNEYLQVIPQDKRLEAPWVASLFARGEKETYAAPEALRHTGMPVGGLFAGTVYLGGAGRRADLGRAGDQRKRGEDGGTEWRCAIALHRLALRFSPRGRGDALRSWRVAGRGAYRKPPPSANQPLRS